MPRLSRTAPSPRSPALLAAAGLVLLGLAGGSLGCAESGTSRSTPRVSSLVPQQTSDGLELASSSNHSVLWVEPDHHLGRHDDVIVQVAGFLYASGQ